MEVNGSKLEVNGSKLEVYLLPWKLVEAFPSTSVSTSTYSRVLPSTCISTSTDFHLTSIDIHLLTYASIDFHELPYLLPPTFMDFPDSRRLPQASPQTSIYVHLLPQASIHFSYDFHQHPDRVGPPSIGFHIVLRHSVDGSIWK